MDNDFNEYDNTKEPTCPLCGLRVYNEICPNCNTLIIDETEDEEEDYDWRERR